MRKIIVILISLISSNLFCQNEYASPFSLKWGASSTPRVLNVDSFSVNRFMLGFQWSGTAPLMKKMLMNSSSGSVGFLLDSTDDLEVDLLHEPIWFSRGPVNIGGGIYPPISQGLSTNLIAFLEYDPRIKITDETKFNPIPNDPKNSIFGFRYNIANLADTVGSGNRLILRDTANYKDSIVMKNIFPNDQFTSYHDLAEETPKTEKMFENWNLTINLRRNSISSDAVKDTNVVLEFRLPYTYKKSHYSIHSPDTIPTLDSTTFHKDYILFDTVSSATSNSTDLDSINFSEFRGMAIKKSRILSDTMSVFKITKNMISTDFNNKDLTISAHFKAMNKYNQNPIDSGNIPILESTWKFQNRMFKDGYLNKFRYYNYKDSVVDGYYYPTELIDSIDIEVTYRGHCDVAVNYIRIENNRAQRALRGVYDAHDKDIIQKCLDTLASYEVAGKKKYKTIRFLSREYESGNPLFWGQLRYLNKITNGLTTTRGSQYLQKHYEYYTGNPNPYYGMKFNEWEVLMPVPYYRFGMQGNPNYLGFKNGFKVFNDGSNYYKSFDSLSSGYETAYGVKSFYDFPNFNKNNEDSVKLYANWLILGVSTNAFIPELEAHDIGNYFLKSVRDFIYSDKPHYMNFFAAPIVYYDDTYVSYTQTHKRLSNALLRPKTGEEVRYLDMKSVLMGAKGLYYDREQQSPDDTTFVGMLGIGDGLKIDSTHGLFDKLVGADFLNDNTRDVYKLMKYMNIDLLGDSLGVNRNRIYFGLQSTRSELFKLHSFIRDNEDLLLKLKIQSWVGKGFKYWKTQHPTNFSDTLDAMKQFIDYDNIKTRKLYLPDIHGNYANNPKTNFETKDSTYFDLMLHKKDSVSLSKQFYFGIMNRRTSPLINIQLSGETTTMQKYFASSYEFDNGIIHGDTIYKFDTYNSKVFQDSNYWKSFYLKRDGVREITIPFSFKPTNNYDYCLLHVKEIHDTSLYISNIRNATKTKLIDTVIGQNSPLSMIMLPGEGKLFSVDVIYPQTNIVGNLDYSNQNKICEYTDTNTKTSTYYATFYKKDTILINWPTKIINRVYFMQSYPTFRDSGTYQSPTNIQPNSPNVRWFNPIVVSDVIKDTYPNSTTFSRVNEDCRFPSLVVGKDSSGQRRGFVVFQCDDTTATKRLIIVESIIKLYSDLTPPEKLTVTRIGESYYDSINTVTLANANNEFGTPVVNYSKYGNFYAWTTKFTNTSPFQGLISGYKTRNQVNLTTLDTITKEMVGEFDVNARCMFRHPGLNPYSQINSTDQTLDSNENEAMLAFQFSTSNNISFGVFNEFLYYTKLRLNTTTGKIYHFLRGYYVGQGIPWDTSIAMQFHDNFQIVQFKWAARMASNPSCFRSPELSSYNNYNYTPIYFERRYWPGVSQLVGFDILEKKDNHSWFINSVSHISPSPYSFSDDLGNPHIGNAQQIKFDTNNIGKYDGLGLVNFTWGDRIYNIPISEKYDLSRSDFSLLSDIADRINYVADGKLPHLTNSFDNNKNKEVWRNRRIFNTIGTNSKIIPSAKYFYKKNNYGDDVTELVGFESDSIFCRFGKISLNGSELKIKLPYTLVDSIPTNNNSDTLYSEWFTVSTTSQLNFVYKSSSYFTHYSSYVERRDSTSHFLLPLVDNCDTCLNLVNATLINGGGHQYRYVLKRLDTLTRYLNEVIVGNIAYGDTLHYKTNGRFNGQLIDLSSGYDNTLELSPNPTNDVLTINIGTFDKENINDKYKLSITNVLGQVIIEKDVSQISLEKLNVSEFNSGTYRVSIYSKGWVGNNIPIISKVFVKVK